MYILFLVNFRAQEEESRLLQGQLDSVADEITQLQGKQSKLVADLQECKRKQLLISHRALKVANIDCLYLFIHIIS